MGHSFHHLTLLMAPLTNEVGVSKQMLREVAIQPLFLTFSMGKTLSYLAGAD